MNLVSASPDHLPRLSDTEVVALQVYLNGQADAALGAMGVMFHCAAREALKEPATVANIRDWLIGRLWGLDFGPDQARDFRLNMNEWNRKGLGVQSVSVNAFHRDAPDAPLLMPHEFKSPTLGVIAPGMLERDKATEYGIADLRACGAEFRDNQLADVQVGHDKIEMVFARLAQA